MRQLLRTYGSPKILAIDRLNRLRILATWASDQAGLALAQGNTPRFMHHFNRVNKLRFAIIKAERERGI